MHIRRLVKAGQTSHTVSLPKNWIDKNHLSKGDVVYVDEGTNNELTITVDAASQQEQTKEITIQIDDKDLTTIRRQITSAYLNNFTMINIIGTSLSQKTKDIREMLNDFVALEISEQTSNKITVKDLLNPKEISIDGNLRRMDMIIRSMLSDAQQSLETKDVHESIEFRDSDVNRLYFLLFRMLKSSVSDPRSASLLGISAGDSLSVWYLTINLQSIARTSKLISKRFKSMKDKKEKIKGTFGKIEQLYNDAIKAYYKKDISLADEVAKNRVDIFNNCRSYLEANTTVEDAELIEEFKDLSTKITNIARITIDQG